MSLLAPPIQTTPQVQYALDKKESLRQKIRQLYDGLVTEYADFWIVSVATTRPLPNGTTMPYQVGPRHPNLTPAAKLAALGTDATTYVTSAFATTAFLASIDPTNAVAPVPPAVPAGYQFLDSNGVVLGTMPYPTTTAPTGALTLQQSSLAPDGVTVVWTTLT